MSRAPSRTPAMPLLLARGMTRTMSWITETTLNVEIESRHDDPDRPHLHRSCVVLRLRDGRVAFGAARSADGPEQQAERHRLDAVVQVVVVEVRAWRQFATLDRKTDEGQQNSRLEPPLLAVRDFGLH